MITGRKFAVFDIDGTLVRWQLYHAVADSLVKLGFIAPVKFQGIKGARMDWKRRESSESYKKYETKLIKLYEDILADITISQFEQAAQNVFDEYKDQVYTWTRDLISDLMKKDYLLFAISGSQIEVVSKIAAYYKFDDCVGTEYVRKNGGFTGENIYHAANKRRVLEGLVNNHRATTEGSVAVGDGISDVPMLELVNTPIAFNPERRLLEVAKKQGWKIVIERKNMVYELEKQNGKYQLMN